MKYPNPYKKSKCESPNFKGYSGCCCRYCLWYTNQKSPWKVGCHGDHQDCEIFIARTTNRHGFKSWGWDGPEKIIVGSGKMPKHIFKSLKDSAFTMAHDLNVKEGWIKE